MRSAADARQVQQTVEEGVAQGNGDAIIDQALAVFAQGAHQVGRDDQAEEERAGAVQQAETRRPIEARIEQYAVDDIAHERGEAMSRPAAISASTINAATA